MSRYRDIARRLGLEWAMRESAIGRLRSEAIAVAAAPEPPETVYGDASCRSLAYCIANLQQLGSMECRT